MSGVAIITSAAGDGLDAHALGGLVELDQREQVVEIGDRQRRHVEFDRPAQQIGLFGLFRVSLIRFLGHADGGIRQRELGVDVQMDEAGSGHAEPERCPRRVAAGAGRNKA